MNQDTTVINFTSEDNFLINPIESPATFDWDLKILNENIRIWNVEKSPYDSQPFEKEIICESYDPYSDDFITINAVTHKIKKNGVIFITNQSLEVGDPIFIRAKKAKNLLCEKYNNELDEGVHAQVIWCNRTSSHENDVCYEVGVEYFN